MEDREDTREYLVVTNNEEQYSIWVAHRQLPLGWTATGFTGLKTECLANIAAVWTDMRPRSLRKQMEGVADTTS
jgi:MbtH protein